MGSANSEKVYDRETLYKQVWDEPMIKVAIRYDVSSVALAKVCRRMDVPVPPRGYWARVRAGMKVERPELVEKEVRKALVHRTYRPRSIEVENRTYLLPEVFENAKRLLEYEASPENSINERAVGSQKLEELKPTIMQLTNTKHVYLRYGRIETRGDDAFCVSVSPSSAPRAISILELLCTAFRKRSFLLRRGSQYMPGLGVDIMGELVRFSIFESAHEVKPTSVKKNDTYVSKEYSPTGEFRIEILNAPSGMTTPKKWKDSGSLRVENQLNLVISGMILAAAWGKENREYWRIHKARDEEVQRLREIEIQKRRLDEKRLSLLISDCNKWVTYTNLLAYCRAVKEHIASSDDVHDEESKRWLDWCEGILVSENPLNNRRPVYSISHYDTTLMKRRDEKG